MLICSFQQGFYEAEGVGKNIFHSFFSFNSASGAHLFSSCFVLLVNIL